MLFRSEALSFLHLLPKDASPILRRLDELRLIELLPEGRLRIPPVRQIRWVGEGPLLEKLYREWALSILNGVARPGLREGELFMIRYFRASKKTVEDLISALKDLEIEFTRRAIQEMRTNSPDLVHLRWLGAVDQKSFLG